MSGARGKLRGPKTFEQRVLVKARYVKGHGKPQQAVKGLRAHLSYLNRSGTGLTNERPEFFTREGSVTREQLSREAKEWGSDQHHFRFIISPERASELDLQSYVKRVMEVMEADLKTKLEWYGTCHYNTDNPHAHIVVRGVDDRGEVLLMTRDYLSHGIRQVAEHEASLRLGKRGPGEVERGVEASLSAERLTPIDRELKELQEQAPDRYLTLKPLRAGAREWEGRARMNRLRRIAFLESRGFATEVKTGVWKLRDDFDQSLKLLSERRKIEKLVSPLLAGTEARKQELVIHKENSPFEHQLRGVVVAKDLSDEMYDRRFILLDADDGRTHFIPLGRFAEPQGFECRAGQVVNVGPPKTNPTSAEIVISRFLMRVAGTFDLAAFSKHVGQAVAKEKWKLPQGLSLEEYVSLFGTRCETLTKAGIVKNLGAGRWAVPADVVEQARAYQELTQNKMRVNVVVESQHSLAGQSQRSGAVWLDRFFDSPEEAFKAYGGFGRELRRELSQREEVLAERGIKVRSGVFKALLSEEEQALRASLTTRYGGAAAMDDGTTLRGRVEGYELLGNGYHMVARTSQGFVLRKVSAREGRLTYGTEIEISRASRGSNRADRGFYRVKVVGAERERGQTKERGEQISK